MKKKLISLDADGTLWYPASTKRKEAPHWIYAELPTPEQYLLEMMLIPETIPALDALRDAGFRLVVLSTNPYPPEKAAEEMKAMMDYFVISHYFDVVMTSPDYPEGKGEVLSQYVAEQGIDKADVVHVGDSYRYDYDSVTNVGFDAILIESEYMKVPEGVEPKMIRAIDQLRSVVEYYE